jgi:hypothetical protein
MSTLDRKAVRVLMSAYWGSEGWRSGKVAKADFEYACAHGVMFPPEVSLSHDALVLRTIKARDAIDFELLPRAFLASLTSRALYFRSAIASYANCAELKPHAFVPRKDPGTAHYCANCESLKGMDRINFNVLNFERIKWGGVRHDQVSYNMFDLEQFALLSIPEPSPDDVRLFKAMLKVIASSAPDDYPGALEKRLKGVSPSNKAERQQLLEILALIGVLAPARHDRPARGKNDWRFIESWRGEDGYDQNRVDELFSQYLS